MKTVQTMQTMKTMKGGIGVLALVFAASFLLILPGCQAPAGPQADRTGTVSLTIGQLDMGRAIQPDIDLSGFTGGFTAVFARTGHDNVTVNFATGATTAQVELPQGEWNLTVNAYIGTVVAATYGPRMVNVQPGLTPVNAVLAPIFTGGYGTFSWTLTVPAGTTGTLEVRGVNEYGNIVMTPIVRHAAFDGTPVSTLWDANLEQLAAGAYFVRFRLTHGDYGVAILGSDLHVYQGMTSHTVRTFTFAHFRDDGDPDTVIYSAAVGVTAPATGAVPNTAATTGTDVNFTAGVVTWSPTHNPFQGNTAYTATVTLTADMGYTFEGLTTATINGYAATVTGNTGAMVTLSFEFPATALAPVDPVIAAWSWAPPAGTSFESAIVGPYNTAIRASGGQAQGDALLQFLTQTGSDLTPRVLSWASGGVNVLPPAGVATDPASSGLNDLANNAWWQTVVSTTDRTNIAVEWRMRSTNTGPRDWRLQYRAGSGGTWRNVGGVINPLPSGNPLLSANALNARFLPATAEGHERLYLRWLMASNASTSPTMNNGLVVAGGTHQINNLTIRSGANSADFDNENDPTGTININWTGFANPLLAQGVTITGSATAGAITISAPENAFTSIQWLDDNMQPLGSGGATLSLPSADFPPLVTVRARTTGSIRTYSIVFDTVTGEVFD